MECPKDIFNIKLLLTLYLLSICCLSISETAFAGPEGREWKISTSLNYEVGKYGTEVTTETFYLPVTLKRYFEKWDLALTIPFVKQKGSSLVTVIDGTTRKKGSKTGSTYVSENSGIGDITLKSGYYLLEEKPFNLTLAGKIKFPTANSSNGLGSGKSDGTVGLEFGKIISPPWTIFLDTYYTFIGSPAGANYNNRISFDIGLSNQITPALSGSIFYEEASSLTNGTPDSRDIILNIEKKISSDTRIFGGIAIGLSESSSDYGISTGFGYYF
jgi:hypothetical protein